MKLTDLNPRWVGAGGEGIYDKDMKPVPPRHGVGVTFDCPCGCADRCYIPFENPLDGGLMLQDEKHSWDRVGDTFETLRLSPSIQRVGGCAWHGFVGKDVPGEVTRA